MIFAKTVSIVLGGVLAVLTLRRLFDTLQQVKAQVQAHQATARVTRLREDPHTGIYYPET